MPSSRERPITTWVRSSLSTLRSVLKPVLMRLAAAGRKMPPITGDGMSDSTAPAFGMKPSTTNTTPAMITGTRVRVLPSSVTLSSATFCGYAVVVKPPISEEIAEPAASPARQ